MFPSRRLPPQPSLEQLRKQAKDLLDQYRAGDPATLTEDARFERHADPQSFALHDAQRVLARAYGYPSWPKLKAFVDGVNVKELAAAVQSGDLPKARILLNSRPELVSMELSENDEHRAIHYAVLRRDAAMVRLLMEAGADARKGIYPHRDATSALVIARDREYDDILAIIEEEERLRREELSCPNATVSPVQDQINAAIAAADNVTAIRLLQADGSLIHACDRDGANPLHIAAEAMNLAMVDWLLQKPGVLRQAVNKPDLRGLTPLDRAALAPGPRNDAAALFPVIAQRLLENGAEVTIRAAVALGDEERTRELIQADPDMLRQIGPHGGLLTLSVNHRHRDVVRLLLDLGADPDERTMLNQLEEPTLSWGQPLWNAALANQLDIARLLLDRGADPNANVYASGWPLGHAWDHEDSSLKNLLLERGARVQDYMVAETHDVAEAERRLAADPGEELTQELLWSAAHHGCPAIVRLTLPRLDWPLNDPRWHWILIQPLRGAEGSAADNEGNFQCMDLLLRQGIDPNISRYGQTTLHFAAAYTGPVGGADRARIASMLIDFGARLDLRDDLLQSTPLGWACRWGRTQLVQTLIDRGAPVEESSPEPWTTPLAWAVKMKREAILAILENARK